MNTKNRIKLITIFCLIGLFSCTDKNDISGGEPYFLIEENPTGVSVGIDGKTNETYIVRSNRKWQIKAQQEADWVRPFPAEGEDDGTFKFIVKENLSFNERVVNFAFVVDGKEQPVLFRVSQEANVPFITVENEVAVPSVETNFVIEVKSNVEWIYSLSNVDWLSEVSFADGKISFLAQKNRGEIRSAKLKISAPEHPTLDKEIAIIQSSGNVILEEGFDWLNYGNPVFYTYSGEQRMDSWTADELAYGWTSTENEYTGNQKVVYARPGFVKLGKTSYGGDLISPKLTALDETTKVKVTFKAVPYKTKGGTEDDNVLRISALGSGTTSVASIAIDNWPDYDVDPNCVTTWEDSSATYEFIITDATSETQIKFLGGDYNLKGVGKGKNRIFLDDIKVTIIED